MSIEHVLETIDHKTMDVGSWVNIIGYIERKTKHRVFVQAVMAWDAGNIDIDAYEQAVLARKSAS